MEGEEAGATWHVSHIPNGLRITCGLCTALLMDPITACLLIELIHLGLYCC